jgi:phosphatidate cytidylyltransferase
MFAQRVLTAAIGIPIILAVVLFGGETLFTAVVAAVLAIAALEYFAATDPEPRTRVEGQTPHQRRGLLSQRPVVWAGAAATGVLAVSAASGLDYLSGALAASLAAIFLLLILLAGPQTGLRDWSWTLTGLTYIGFLGAHLVLLRDFSKGEDWVLLALLATFATDTSAYFGGKVFGRTHITPRISPGKTLEGFIDGYIGGFAAVFLLEWLTDANMSTLDTLLLAALLPPAAMLGDLAESMIKRGGGVKDTSELVPGHGGLLDRLDSILFTAPLVFYFAIWVV